jgi:signal transduction histidine kinase
MILAEIYSKTGENKKAIRTLQNAENKLNTLQKPKQLMSIYSLLVEKNKAINNYKNAYDYKILEANLRDSIISEKMQKNIAELEVKFETEKKEREILAQKRTIEKKNTQRNLMIYGLIALGFISVLTILFFRNKLKYQKTIASQTEAIQKQEITDLQQKNKLLALNSMIEGQEAERLRIANDLHDSLGGLLSTVKAHFTTIQKEIEQLEQLNITKKTNDLIDEACIEVRRISHNMMPHALSISGIEGAVTDLGEQLNEQGFQTSVEINNLPKNMEETKKIMIYRLIQEIISNITKHADAKSILIQLIGHNNEVNLIIEDDGKGFNYSEAFKKSGLGLKSINSRVEFLDGTIDWDSKLNNGTSITINIPLS